MSEQDERQRLISTIDDLYPADSGFEGTAEVGRRFLKEAQDRVRGWRTEPIEVLRVYAALCLEEEFKPPRSRTPTNY